MRRSIIIELTSLLDVILILFFLVLVSGTKKAEAMETSAAAVQESLTKSLVAVEEEREQLEIALQGVSVLTENCRLITVTVSDNGEERLIFVRAGDAQPERIRLAWGEEQYAKNALNAALRKAAVLDAGEQMALIAFQYDRRKLYQSDYELIVRSLRDAAGKNVYLAEYDVTMALHK